MELNMKKTRIAVDVLLILIAGLLSGIGLHTFVDPANFASSGVEGIAVMVQKLTGVNVGIVTFVINMPLLIVAWFFINKKYVVYTMLYSVFSSAAIILMEQLNMYQYVTENNAWISVFASGIILGARTAIMIKVGGSSGGVDIAASMIQKRRPYLNIETLIAVFCYVTIGASFFVYWNLESVIMSVVQMLIFNIAISYVLRPSRRAVEVRIITDNPEEFKEYILTHLKHGATVIPCQGMFTSKEKTMIVTIINIHQMNDLIKLSRKYPNSFIYFDDVTGVWGNFRWSKHDLVK